MTERELDIMVTLTQRVRCMSAKQLAAGWWNCSKSGEMAARKTAATLIRRGFLLKERVLVDPMLPLDAPLIIWNPREKAPDPKETAALLHARWNADLEARTIYSASWTAARLFGGYGGGIASILQVTHDLHVAELYLRFKASHGSTSMRWVSEDVRTALRGEKVPDAYLLSPSGHIQCVIEFGGKYTAERVADFHAHCQNNELPYQLW